MYPILHAVKGKMPVGYLCLSQLANQKLYFMQCRTYKTRNILKLKERGLWADIFPDYNTNKFIQELTKQPQTVYCGFDPTADSLHVGHLLVLMALIHCQRAGHSVIAVIGGATAQIGDPSGRKTERPELSPSQVNANAVKISKNLSQIFSHHQKYFWERGERETLPTLRIENNLQWYEKMNVINFLRAGRSLRMGDMLTRTSVKSRLSSPEGLSFTEFSYQALQAYDWLYLYDKYSCTIQIGGNDQMGNIYAGHWLIDRVRNASVTGLTVPLVTDESGNKFGKSAGNPVWLDSNKTSPFEFYQYFMRLKDTEVENYLLLLTFLPVQDVKNVMETHRSKPETRHAQTKLAEKVTLLVHGNSGLTLARRVSSVLYGNQVEALIEMTEKELQLISEMGASASIVLEPGTSVLDMALKAKCFLNEKDARRIIEAGGFYINLARVTNPDLILIPGVHILPNKYTLARVGKKNYHLIKWYG